MGHSRIRVFQSPRTLTVVLSLDSTPPLSLVSNSALPVFSGRYVGHLRLSASLSNKFS